MAITPRTVLSEPINLLMFAMGVVAITSMVVVFGGGDADCPRTANHADAGAAPDVARLDSADARSDWPAAASITSAAPHRLDYTCQLAEPAGDWGEQQWLRHLDCMQARGEADEVLLAEVDRAIGAVGLTPELAVHKADLLATVGTADEHIAFLHGAVRELGVVDGRLVHRLSRALVWRGQRSDLEHIRHLQLLSRMLMPESCRVLETDVWAHYMMAQDAADPDSTAAWQGVQRAVRTWTAQGCHERVHQGRWDVLAEMVGVGVAAEATNGHDGHSSLIREVTDAYEVRQVPVLCRDAVPANTGLRSYCEKRIGDEQFLAR